MIKLSEAAARDIEELLAQSIIDFGLAQTQKYVHSLKECLELLDQFPEMGMVSDDIRPGYRRFAHQSHVFFYKQDAQDVFIVRVLHEHMDVTKQRP